MNTSKDNISVMMEPEEISMIEKYLNSDNIMLEYGSGGSTLHYSKLVKEYYSVEHNPRWHHLIKDIIPENCHTKLIHNKFNNVNVDSKTWKHLSPNSRVDWQTLLTGEYYNAFKEYIEYPTTINKKFDRILIDGRARPECAKYVYDYINDDAIVFIHDFYKELYDDKGKHMRTGGRPHYHILLEKYKIIDSIETLVVLVKPGGYLKRI
tara:strand:+ start:1122 stop:1745 length:624 start_codon:yes stop_codon:yes gene_type:complete